MKVRDLKNGLTVIIADETRITDMLTRVSHWVKKIYTEGDYSTDNEKEMATLENLRKLKVVTIRKSGGKFLVSLTKDGRELYMDFFNLGYFGLNPITRM